MQTLFDPQIWLTLLLLTGLEIVLGFDNLVVLTLASQELPAAQQSVARRVGLSLAVITRLLLLALAFCLVQMAQPIFSILDRGISARDLVLFFGGVFLLYSALKQFIQDFQQPSSTSSPRKSAFLWVMIKMLIMDIVFSIDTVITAVGIAQVYWVMALAIVLAILCMIWGSDMLSTWILRFPRLKTLALAFLFVLGVMLIGESFGSELHRRYLYVAIGFSALIEILNILYEKRGIRK